MIWRGYRRQAKRTILEKRRIIQGVVREGGSAYLNVQLCYARCGFRKRGGRGPSGIRCHTKGKNFTHAIVDAEARAKSQFIKYIFDGGHVK